MKAPGWYMCEYCPHPEWSASGKATPGNYSSFVYANNLEDAMLMAARRGIGEKVLGHARPTKSRPYRYPSELLMRRKQDRIEIVHGVTFLSYILLMSKLCQPWDIVGDEGLLHQTIHCLQHGRPEKTRMRNMLIHFELKAPGYRGRNE